MIKNQKAENNRNQKLADVLRNYTTICKLRVTHWQFKIPKKLVQMRKITPNNQNPRYRFCFLDFGMHKLQ